MQTFPNKTVCLEQHFTKSPFSPFHLQEVQPADTPCLPFPIFSFIPTAAAPGCSLWTYPTQPETKSQGESAKRNFFPQTGSYIPNLPALNQKPAPTLLLLPRTWMKTVFVDRKVLSDQTGKNFWFSTHSMSWSEDRELTFLNPASYCNWHSFIRSLLSCSTGAHPGFYTDLTEHRKKCLLTHHQIVSKQGTLSSVSVQQRPCWVILDHLPPVNH